MRILITGGAGFIGSHIAAAYLRDGHEVAVLDNFRTGSKRNLPAGAALFVGDISQAEDVAAAFQQFQPEVISHHAAQLDVRHSLEDPAYDAATNILGGLNILLQAARGGVRRFIFASSGGAVYGDAEPLPTGEETPARPLSPYGLTKWTFEAYLHIWRQVHGIVPVILRYANVYGPRQNAQGEAGVVAVFSRRLLRGKPCVIYGDGESTRDYVYVSDVVRANQLALTHAEGGTFNIGTGCQTTVRTVFDTVRGAADRILGEDAAGPRQPAFAPVRAGEISRSALDNRRAGEVLGWTPQTSFADGVACTVEWLHHHA